jgi:dTDP-4-dehydrorhamnose 3,5-epimerase
MIFRQLRLKDAFIVDIEKMEDERGFFARAFCEREFEAHGLNRRLVQSSISFNKKKGTLRGMHYQTAPNEEAKVVRCTQGAIYDVIIDLRQCSPTFKQWEAVELTSENRRMIYIPEGFAHGFQTLEHNSEVLYHMTECYAPEAARGVRWDDPAFGIRWPAADRTIAPRDQQYPAFIL